MMLQDNMKKLIISLGLILLFSPISYSQILTASFDIRANRSTTDPFNIANRSMSAHIFTWSIQVGTLSACTINIQTSPDNTPTSTWTTQYSTGCTVGGTSNYLTFTANWIRINATVFTGTTNAFLTINYAGYIIAPTSIATYTNALPTSQTPFTVLGTLSASKTAGGTLTAQTYFITVIGVSPNGGETLLPQDQNASAEINIAITAGDVAAGNQSLSISFIGDSSLASYRAYYGLNSGIYLQYVGCTTSPCIITTVPVSFPSGLALSLSTQTTSLRSQCYYLKIVAVIGTGVTAGRTFNGDNNSQFQCLTAAQDKAQAIVATWNSVATADHYELYIASTSYGGPRQFIQYINVGNVTTYTYTGQTTLYQPIWGNGDYQSASEFLVGSLRALSEGRSSFGGDIISACTIGVECQHIFERRSLSNPAGAAQNTYAGFGIRHNGITDWEIGQASIHADQLTAWNLNGDHVGFRSYQPSIVDELIIDRTVNKLSTPLDLIFDANLGPANIANGRIFGGTLAGSTVNIYAISNGTAVAGDGTSVTLGLSTSQPIITLYDSGASGAILPVVIGPITTVSVGVNSNIKLSINAATSSVVKEFRNTLNGANGNQLVDSYVAKTNNGTDSEMGAFVIVEGASAGVSATITDAYLKYRNYNGSNVVFFYNGIKVGAPSGCSTFNDCGSGSINLQSLWANGTQIIASTGNVLPTALQLNTGTSPASGYIALGVTTVGSLPMAAAGNKGQMISVSDSTSVAAEGQTCVGLSTNSAVAISNGSVWKCF